MPTKYSILFYVTFLLLCGCKGQVVEEATSASYQAEIEQWRAERVESLKQPDSWLSLAGLYFLQEGPNPFGSNSDNKLKFPEKAPGKMGTIWLEGGKIRLIVEDGNNIQLNDSLITAGELVVHTEQTPCILKQGSLSWFLLQRDDRFLVRLKDAKNAAFDQFSSFDQYPIDNKWKIPARFVPKSQKIAIKNVLDMEFGQESEGLLRFEIDGQTFELAVLNGGMNDYFIIFADRTTGEETYGGGRYLYAPKADSEGNTFLDFNKAYNPPCVFTPYATCLLPPTQNRLDIAITAGEKNYGDH